jgi:hypothetical protein
VALSHLQVAPTNGVALATPMAALSGPIPKAPGFAGGYLLEMISAVVSRNSFMIKITSPSPSARVSPPPILLKLVPDT